MISRDVCGCVLSKQVKRKNLNPVSFYVGVCSEYIAWFYAIFLDGGWVNLSKCAEGLSVFFVH